MEIEVIGVLGTLTVVNASALFTAARALRNGRGNANSGNPGPSSKTIKDRHEEIMECLGRIERAIKNLGEE
jgi:hypothetical protein